MIFKIKTPSEDGAVGGTLIPPTIRLRTTESFPESAFWW